MDEILKFMNDKMHWLEDNCWMADVQAIQNMWMIFKYYGLIGSPFDHISFQKLMSDGDSDDDCVLTFFLAITRIHPDWEQAYEEYENEQVKKKVSRRVGI